MYIFYCIPEFFDPKWFFCLSVFTFVLHLLWMKIILFKGYILQRIKMKTLNIINKKCFNNYTCWDKKRKLNHISLGVKFKNISNILFECIKKNRYRFYRFIFFFSKLGNFAYFKLVYLSLLSFLYACRVKTIRPSMFTSRPPGKENMVNKEIYHYIYVYRTTIFYRQKKK